MENEGKRERRITLTRWKASLVMRLGVGLAIAIPFLLIAFGFWLGRL